MANWTTRKSKSGPAGYRQTTTTTIGKGITNSSGFGNKAGRTTFSSGPNGTKIYETTRSGDWYKRSQKTISSNKTKKMSKREAKALGNAIVFLALAPFKIVSWLLK